MQDAKKLLCLVQGNRGRAKLGDFFFFFFSFVWLGGSEKGIKNEGFSFPPNPLFLFLPKYCGIEREKENVKNYSFLI